MLVEAEGAGSLKRVQVECKVKGFWWRTTVNENCLRLGFPALYSRYIEFYEMFLNRGP
jgi:hypothetical protein